MTKRNKITEERRLRTWLQNIAEVFDARSELFTSDEECAASLADRAKAALKGKICGYTSDNLRCG